VARSSAGPSARRSTDPPRSLTDADYRALGEFRLALRQFLAFSEAGARAVGLTAQQHQALLAIRAHAGPEAISIGELADTLLIKNHSAVGLVDRLVGRGFVKRDNSAEDRRRVLLSLTPEAKAVLEAISQGNIRELRGTAKAVTALLATVRSVEKAGAAPAG
jgi:DNA-binding MarR family transcriptional regulator